MVADNRINPEEHKLGDFEITWNVRQRVTDDTDDIYIVEFSTPFFTQYTIVTPQTFWDIDKTIIELTETFLEGMDVEDDDYDYEFDPDFDADKR